MNTFLLLVLASYLQTSVVSPIPLPHGRGAVQRLVTEVAESGRVLNLVPVLDDEVRIAPGAPPLLSFRYLEGRQRGRFGGLDLVLDDAGH